MRTRAFIWTMLAAAGAGAASLIAFWNGAFESAPKQVKPANLTDDGTLLLRGKPFFPIGIYHVNHTDEEYALLAANGFNAVQGNFSTEVGVFVQTLDLAQRHNLAVDVPLYAEGLVKENLDKSLAKIRAATGHPAVLSWKICDEPDSNLHARRRREIQAAYRAIKDVNPLESVELTLCQDESLGVWTRYCDLVQIDRYPVPGHRLTQVSDFCQQARKKMQPWQNLTYVVQCGWTSDLKTQPTFAQARAMVYLAIISGAKGIFWFARQEEPDWDLTTSPLWPRLKEINAEIASLSMPVMLGLDVTGIQCSESAVQFMGKRDAEKLYLLATNPGDAPVKAVFSLPAGIHVRAVRVAGTGQPLPLNGASVSIALGGIDSATLVFDL